LVSAVPSSTTARQWVTLLTQLCGGEILRLPAKSLARTKEAPLLHRQPNGSSPLHFAVTILAGFCSHTNTTGVDDATAEAGVALADALIEKLNEPKTK
jgi:hypothetical protein